MTKGNWSALLLGVLLSSAVACKPFADEDPIPQNAEDLKTVEAIDSAPTMRPATAIAQRPTVTTPSPEKPTSTPPPLPTPEPTIGVESIPEPRWKAIGDETNALGIAIPLDWIDLSGQIDVSTATNRMGLIVLLAADSNRTGSSILAGKALPGGAFVAGMILNEDGSTSDPTLSLSQLVAKSGLEAATFDDPAPLSLPLMARESLAGTDSVLVEGASVELAGDPTGLVKEGVNDLRTRMLLLPVAQFTGASDSGAKALILQTAPSDQWTLYGEIFNQMADSVVLRNPDEGFTINDGSANLLGTLAPMESVNGRLDTGSSDIWTFEGRANGYATLSLTPIDPDIDLVMRIIAPGGEQLVWIDNGYAGDAEVSADLFIADEGTYLVEVGEFFGNSGRYALSLLVGDAPMFGSSGRIIPGQVIQSQLAEKARQNWTFEGTAGQTVSIILSTDSDQMDMILELYGPEGEQLLSLDEGFSGDAEVIAGYELPITGEYTIRVRSFAGNGGAYSLSLDEGGENTLNYFDAGDLSDGDVATETLRANEAHAWFFEGRVGQEISVEILPSSDELDIDLWLLDPGIAKLAVADDFAAGEPESIQFVLAQDGQYLVLVRDFYGRPGSYEIRFTSTMANAPAIAGTIAFGTPLTATLEAGQATLWYFRVEVDDILEIRLVPFNEDDDVLFILQDPAANTVLEVDAALAGLPEELSNFKITTSGRWRLVIKEFFAEAADYSLTVNRTRR